MKYDRVIDLRTAAEIASANEQILQRQLDEELRIDEERRSADWSTPYADCAAWLRRRRIDFVLWARNCEAHEFFLDQEGGDMFRFLENLGGWVERRGKPRPGTVVPSGRYAELTTRIKRRVGSLRRETGSQFVLAWCTIGARDFACSTEFHPSAEHDASLPPGTSSEFIIGALIDNMADDLELTYNHTDDPA